MKNPAAGTKLDPQFFSFVVYFLKGRNAGEENMAQGKSFDMAEEFAGLNFHSIRLENRFIATEPPSELVQR
jgi:hypothetical protein